MSAVGDLALKVAAQGTSKHVMAVLDDVLWVLGLSCRLLSPGTIRREGGVFLDPRAHARYIRICNDALKVSLVEKKSFLTLERCQARCAQPHKSDGDQARREA